MGTPDYIAPEVFKQSGYNHVRKRLSVCLAGGLSFCWCLESRLVVVGSDHVRDVDRLPAVLRGQSSGNLSQSDELPGNAALSSRDSHFQRRQRSHSPVRRRTNERTREIDRLSLDSARTPIAVWVRWKRSATICSFSEWIGITFAIDLLPINLE